jgi:hypothetical protein
LIPVQSIGLFVAEGAGEEMVKEVRVTLLGLSL